MSRLNTAAVSQELRDLLAAASFSTFTLATIPTGRDTRRFTQADQFPQCVVHVKASVAVPRAIGGVMKATHQVALFYIFRYADNEDYNLTKLQAGAALVDWLCDHKSGTTYQMFSNAGVQVQYDPPEELAYGVESSIAVLKIEFAVDQPQSFAL